MAARRQTPRRANDPASSRKFTWVATSAAATTRTSVLAIHFQRRSPRALSGRLSAVAGANMADALNDVVLFLLRDLVKERQDKGFIGGGCGFRQSTLPR